MTYAIVIVAGLILLPYVLGPILIRLTLRINARPALEPMGVEAMPPEVYEYFGWTAPGLAACRFEVVAYFAVREQVPNVTAYVALWIARSTGQAATAVVTYAQAGGATPRVQRYLEFLTKPVPGASVLTNNTAELNSFKIDPREKDVMSLPQVQDVAALYQVHLNRELRLIRKDATRYVPSAGRELDYFAEAIEREVASQVQTGRLYHDNSSIYRPTMGGAMVMTWGQLFPMKQIRKSQAKQRAATELAQSRPVPFPANVRITEQSPYESTHEPVATNQM